MGNREQFALDYAPLAAKVGEELGVSPNAIIAQWGLETGWGKSVVAGTNNLGNIKDFRVGSDSVKAKDNMTGSTDRYRKFETPEAFADHYVGLIKRKYPDAMNTGSDTTAFATGLKKGGYAEDPTYVDKVVHAAKGFGETVMNAVIPSAQAAELPSDDELRARFEKAGYKRVQAEPAPVTTPEPVAALPSDEELHARFAKAGYKRVAADPATTTPATPNKPATDPATQATEAESHVPTTLVTGVPYYGAKGLEKAARFVGADKVADSAAGMADDVSKFDLGLQRGVRDLIDGPAYLLPKGIEKAARFVGANRVADWANKEATNVSNINKQAEDQYQAATPGSFAAGAGRVGGNVATAAIPVGAGGKVLQVANKVLPKVVARVGTNAVTGATMGALATKTDDQSIVDNAIGGAIAGPVVGEVVNRVAAPLGQAVKTGYQKVVDAANKFGYKPSTAQIVNATGDASTLLQKAVSAIDKVSPVGGGKARADLEKAVAETINKPIGVDGDRVVRESYNNLPSPYAEYDAATAGRNVTLDPTQAAKELAAARAKLAVSDNPTHSTNAYLDKIEQHFAPNNGAANQMSLADIQHKATQAAENSAGAFQGGQTLDGNAYGHVVEALNKVRDSALSPAERAMREKGVDLAARQEFAKTLAAQLGKNEHAKSAQLMAATKASKDAPKDLVKMAETIRDMQALETPSEIANWGRGVNVVTGLGHAALSPVTATVQAAPLAMNLALQSNRQPLVKALTGNTAWQQALGNNQTPAAILAARLAAMMNDK